MNKLTEAIAGAVLMAGMGAVSAGETPEIVGAAKAGETPEILGAADYQALSTSKMSSITGEQRLRVTLSVAGLTLSADVEISGLPPLPLPSLPI